ncbi:E3 ubiquitin-protein ligase TRIM47-like [Amia ocellicauda]|uniref:E3 ubiquitin-protein ligase TRIM47-like n=1 Tax=Amia ocellicauda TaxID=2972642 RepID=UPI003464491D
MATSGTPTIGKQLQCPICLNTLTKPVSTPCGHTFCMSCIDQYWARHTSYKCPMCKKRFNNKPELGINKVFAEITEQFKRRRLSYENEQFAKPGEVCCDFCTERKLRAVKSCLVCMVSYCQTHLEPHQRVGTLKTHKLIEPVSNLEDRLCKKHDRPLDLFCRSDRTCVCVLCTETDHREHSIVPAEEECTEKKAHLVTTEVEIKHMVQDRLKKLEEIRQLMELSKVSPDRVRVFTALMRSIQRCQTEMIELVKEKQKALEREAEGLIKDLEHEIKELKKRHTVLKQLSRTEDHIYFLQSFSALCAPSDTKDWSDINMHSDFCLGTVRRAVSLLEERNWKSCQKSTE